MNNNTYYIVSLNRKVNKEKLSNNSRWHHDADRIPKDEYKNKRFRNIYRKVSMRWNSQVNFPEKTR